MHGQRRKYFIADLDLLIHTDSNVQKVNEFTFVVQMAWTPRSEQERLDARAARLAKIAADKKAEEGETIEEEG